MKKLINLSIVLVMVLGLLPARTAIAEVTPLWEQLPNGGGALGSMIGDTIHADNFNLTEASSIAQIEIWSNYAGPYDLTFDIYANTIDTGGYNIPGVLVGTKVINSIGEEDDICPQNGDGYYYCKYRHTLSFDSPLELAAGHYWLSVYGSAGSNFGWSPADIPSQWETYALKYQDYPWNGQYSNTAFAFRLLEPQQTCPASVVVANTNDSGTGSLRQAIADMCEGGTITFDLEPEDLTVTLSSQLTIDKNLTIDGSMLTEKVTISGNNNTQVFVVNGNYTISLDSLIISDGDASYSSGGGIYNIDATVDIRNSTLKSNKADYNGGAIYNNGGTVKVTDSILESNIANGGFGGGIYNNSGTLEVTNSTLSDNLAIYGGGGIATDIGTITTITGSTLTRNDAVGVTGGGLNNYGTATVVNSTFFDNQATMGGGIFNDASLTLYNSTLSGNSTFSTDSGTLENYTSNISAPATLTMANTIIANSLGNSPSDPPNDCANTDGTISENTNNLVGDGTCSENVTGFLSGDPMLGSLADNGGQTQTMALLPGSPAIDAGDATICGGTLVGGVDQRGVPRPQPEGGACDIGAYEYEPVVTPSLIVNSNNDDTDGTCDESHCSLREAVNAASVSGDTITFAESLSGATITLADELPLDKSVTIDGSMLAEKVTISGNNLVRVFNISSGSVTLDSLIIVDGHADDEETDWGTYGGGIYNDGTLTIKNSVLFNNNASWVGGGVYNNDDLTIMNSVMEGNSAEIGGGGVHNSTSGSLTVKDSTIANNSSSSGGGLYNEGQLTLSGSTLVGNEALDSGGGIYNFGSAAVINTTFTQNFAPSLGSGIYTFGAMTLYNSTLAGNLGSPTLVNTDATGKLNFANTIVANTTSGSDCFNSNGGEIVSNYHNLVGDGTCSENSTGFLSGNPQLDSLGDNGGPTHTMALLPGSPAIDAGDDSICAASPVNGVDQRGVPRPQPEGGACDIGAYEYEPVVTPSLIVNTNNDITDGTCDESHCSLREAINAAALSGDTITFAESLSGATITLASQLILNKDLTIDGSILDPKVTISGDEKYRVFEVDRDVSVTLDSLIIANGYHSSYGGGINNAGTLTVTNSTLAFNEAGFGGGINNDDYGTLFVTYSTLDSNTATHNGGGIFNMCNANYGSVLVSNSTLSGNTASFGGGIASEHPGDTETNVISSTIIGNQATETSGGGLLNGLHGTMTVVNSTLSNNTAPQYGGGICNFGTLTLYNSTLSGNSRHSGGFEGHGLANLESGILNYANTIIADSPTGTACYNEATISTNFNNLVEEGEWTGGCSASLNVDPLLAPLADNGGPTHTMALLPGSPAIDAGDDTICSDPLVGNVDQRGVQRPYGAHCDIGAFELELPYLWEQLPNGVSDGSSEAGLQIFADDFVLAEASSIIQIEIWNRMAGPVDIYFEIYDNATASGYDIPGVSLISGMVTSSGVDEEDTICSHYSCEYRHTLALDEPLDLEPGHYWLSVYGSQNSGFSWSFANIPTESPYYAAIFAGTTSWDGSLAGALAFRLLEPQGTSDTGALKISKVFDPLTSGFTGTFAIEYDCDDGETHDGTVNLVAGASETITGIPTGTTCTVSETPPSAPEGWTFGSPTLNPVDGVVTISEVSPAYAEVTVTNTISRDLGNLTISKDFDAGDSGFTGTFTIVYDCDGDLYDGTVDLAAGESETIYDIPTGTICTVTEPTLPVAPDGWTFGEPSFDPENGRVEITGSSLNIIGISMVPVGAEVTVYNTISRDLGELKISKVFDPLTSGFTGTFAIDYNCDDGTAHDGTVHLEAGGTTTITGIPTGTTCTVSETTLPSAPEEWAFGTPTFSPETGMVIISGTIAEVTVTNTINPVSPQENQPPILDAIGNKSVHLYTLLTFTANATDDGLPGDTLTYSLADGVSGSIPAGASMVPATGLFTWTPSILGAFTFDVCVSDGELQDCETITVTVTEGSVVPALPSSFYGHISITGVVAGDYVLAHIDNQADVVASDMIEDDGTGVLVYSLNVPAYPDGSYPDTVIFKINEKVVATAPWASGTNVRLDIEDVATHQIDLVVGWNLVSFNVIPTSTATIDVLSTIANKYDLVYAWDATGASSMAGNWMIYDPKMPPGLVTLTDLNHRMGFWIRMTEAATLTVSGLYPTETEILFDITAGGWNLVGYPASVNRDLPTALDAHGVEDFTLVYAYHAADTTEPWKLFDIDAPDWVNTLLAMSPGKGYWVFVTANATLTVPFQ